MENTEYKIIKSSTPTFANTAKMHTVLAKEAEAGWKLVGKEDNYQLKLQRDISHRDNDKNLSFDAYRVDVGVSPVITYTITAVAALAVVAIILNASGIL